MLLANTAGAFLVLLKSAQASDILQLADKEDASAP